jgi:hypothetical protein
MLDEISEVRGQFLTTRFVPGGEIWPLGGMLTHSFAPRGEFSLQFWRMERRTEYFTPIGDNFTLGDKIHPLGEN